jgi:uncharacterized damage-inducible protein DinB
MTPLPDPLHQHLAMMARYNRWASERLFEQVDTLSEDEYRRDTGLFFKSIHGTLNHLLVAEQLLWFRRFAHGEAPAMQLDAEAEPDRARLRARLLEGAQAWLPWLAALPPARLGSPFAYRSTKGQDLVLPFAATLAHVFNHSTHHRGQVSAGLTMLGRPAPVIDLAHMLIQESATR